MFKLPLFGGFLVQTTYLVSKPVRNLAERCRKILHKVIKTMKNNASCPSTTGWKLIKDTATATGVVTSYKSQLQCHQGWFPRQIIYQQSFIFQQKWLEICNAFFFSCFCLPIKYRFFLKDGSTLMMQHEQETTLCPQAFSISSSRFWKPVQLQVLN